MFFFGMRRGGFDESIVGRCFPDVNICSLSVTWVEKPLEFCYYFLSDAIFTLDVLQIPSHFNRSVMLPQELSVPIMLTNICKSFVTSLAIFSSVI